MGPAIAPLVRLLTNLFSPEASTSLGAEHSIQLPASASSVNSYQPLSTQTRRLPSVNDDQQRLHRLNPQVSSTSFVRTHLSSQHSPLSPFYSRASVIARPSPARSVEVALLTFPTRCQKLEEGQTGPVVQVGDDRTRRTNASLERFPSLPLFLPVQSTDTDVLEHVIRHIFVTSAIVCLRGIDQSGPDRRKV